MYSKPRYCSESRAKEITDRIATMVALDLRPMYMVKCEGFRNLLGYLEPAYKVPSRQHITSLIHRKHDAAKKLLCTTLKEASSVALSTDIWTSMATEAYITVTAHYISTNWELFSFVLETKSFPERHSGKAISEKLIEIAENFALSRKVSTVVHDQAANMELSLEILNSDMGWETLHCSAHCLQLCLKAGLSSNAIDRLIGAARKLVGHFNRSVVASEELKKREVQMNIAEKKLVQDCATRWNSTFYMLQRLLELRWPVTAVLSDERVTKRSDRHLDLTSEHWALAEELVRILHPFEVATTFFSYEENTSLSCVLPILHGLVDSLQQQPNPSETVSPSVRQFKQKVAGEIKQRWDLDSPNLSSPWVLALAVDPRFRQLKFLDEEQVDSVKSELERQMENSVDSLPSADSTDPSANEPPEKRQKVEKETALDLLLGTDTTQVSTKLSAREEVEQYFSERPISRRDHPLTWWKANEQRFHRLAKVAQEILAIPATSTPSERIFSVAGLTVTKLRSCLKPSNVDALVFLNKNLKLL